MTTLTIESDAVRFCAEGTAELRDVSLAASHIFMLGVFESGYAMFKNLQDGHKEWEVVG